MFSLLINQHMACCGESININISLSLSLSLLDEISYDVKGGER